MEVLRLLVKHKALLTRPMASVRKLTMKAARLEDLPNGAWADAQEEVALGGRVRIGAGQRLDAHAVEPRDSTGMEVPCPDPCPAGRSHSCQIRLGNHRNCSEQGQTDDVAQGWWGKGKGGKGKGGKGKNTKRKYDDQ